VRPVFLYALGGLLLLVLAAVGLAALARSSRSSGGSSSPGGYAPARTAAAEAPQVPPELARQAGEDTEDYCSRIYRPTFKLCCAQVRGSFGSGGCDFGSEESAFFACVASRQEQTGCKGHDGASAGSGSGSSGGSDWCDSRASAAAEYCCRNVGGTWAGARGCFNFNQSQGVRMISCIERELSSAGCR
jgi:hypothetical protein